MTADRELATRVASSSGGPCTSERQAVGVPNDRCAARVMRVRGWLSRRTRSQGVGDRFFLYVIGSEVASSPEKAKLIVKQGHRIQNHSWSHINLAKAPESEVRSQLEKTQQAIREATGVAPTKVRPPYGAGGWPQKYDLELAKTAKALSLRIENWDVDTEDWKAPQSLGASKIENVRSQLSASKLARSIVLLHVQPGTARGLPAFLQQMKSWGFGLRDREIIAASDAVLIATPEYGYSLPGSLKNGIDWLIGSGELDRKVVAITASVNHVDRGRRGLAALRETLQAANANILGGEPPVRGPQFESHLRALLRSIVEAVEAG